MRVTFCLRSLATQGGSVNTRTVATERLAKRDKFSENFSLSKTDRQLGFRSHKRNRILVCACAHFNSIDEFTTSGKTTKLKQKTKSELNLNSLRDE